jgi:hypothetical protein
LKTRPRQQPTLPRILRALKERFAFSLLIDRLRPHLNLHDMSTTFIGRGRLVIPQRIAFSKAIPGRSSFLF